MRTLGYFLGFLFAKFNYYHGEVVEEKKAWALINGVEIKTRPLTKAERLFIPSCLTKITLEVME